MDNPPRLLAALREQSARMPRVMCGGLTHEPAVALGIACRALVPVGMPPKRVLSAALLPHLPAWASTPILPGIFSAVIAAGDFRIITAASVCSNDILRRPGVAACRLGLLGTALVGHGADPLRQRHSGLAAHGQRYLRLRRGAVVFVGMLLYRKARFRPRGVVAAMLDGGLLGRTATLADNSAWSVAGRAVSPPGSLLAAAQRVKEATPRAAAAADPGR